MTQQYTYTIDGEPLEFRSSDDYFKTGSGEAERWHPRDALTIWSGEELAAFGIERSEVQQSAPTAAEICVCINNLRDAKIDGGFTFLNARFQSAPSDRENIDGMKQIADAAISRGAMPGNFRWMDPTEDFAWILEDNSRLPMSAQQVVALWNRGVAFKMSLTKYARDLKDTVTQAEDPNSIDILNGWPE